jgi:hypothetical protein
MCARLYIFDHFMGAISVGGRNSGAEAYCSVVFQLRGLAEPAGIISYEPSVNFDGGKSKLWSRAISFDIVCFKRHVP